MSKKLKKSVEINRMIGKSNDKIFSDEEIIARAEQLWAENEYNSALKAVSLLQQLFDKGETKATAYRLGTAYYLGKGVSKNLETAYQYLLLDDSRSALYYRGLILSDKNFSGFNLQLALKCFSEALKMGVPKAQAYIDKISPLLNKGTKEAIGNGVKAIVPIKCSLCNKIMQTVVRSNQCPHCMGAPRTRMLPVVLNALRDQISLDLAKSKPLLGFAVTNVEEQVLSKVFPTLTSVSLYGNYLKNHIQGCDVRDLSRFPDNSFSGIFSILLFDYFVEIDKALAECARVTAPGGIFITYIAHNRLVNQDLPPTISSIIKKTETYFHYIPDNANMPSIKVGIQNFINAMQLAGYQAGHYSIQDLASGEITDWFVGFVPDKI